MNSQSFVFGMDASDGEEIIDKSEEEEESNEKQEQQNPNIATESQAQNSRINLLLEKINEIPSVQGTQETNDSQFSQESISSISTDSQEVSTPASLESLPNDKEADYTKNIIGLSSDSDLNLAIPDDSDDSQENTKDIEIIRGKHNDSSDIISEDEDSVEEPSTDKKSAKKVKSLKQRSLPLRVIKQKNQKQTTLTDFNESSQDTEDNTVVIYRMITKICELFNNKYTFPQVLATIHCCAGDVEKALFVLREKGPLGEAETILDATKVQAPKVLKDEYFQV